MKKGLALMFACMLAITASAQEHLTFKGIAINGSLTSFVSKLKAQGFTETAKDNTSTVLEGEFGGRDCQIFINASQSTQTVYQAVVVLDKDNSWSSLKSTYSEYKSLLKSKYGSGTSYERFMSPYEEGDGYEMTAVRNDKCLYCTIYELQNGKILLTINDVYNGAVLLYYTDKINGNLADREKSTQQINDL